jgi:AcrR family transcriptional regulator
MTDTASNDGDDKGSGDSQAESRICEAALECFVARGMDHTSMQDVAQAAGVSRGTIYRYYKDRQALISAAVAYGATDHYASVAAEMDRQPDFDRQLEVFARRTARGIVEKKTDSGLFRGDVDLIRYVLSDTGSLLRRNVDCLRPYVAAARERGEIDPKVDVDQAAEWLARMVLSVAQVPASASVNSRDSESVTRFIRRYAVAGLRDRADT